ncbi:MAG: hypothetical protein DMF83_21625, partial [Acidobacteria bacterium]
MRLLSVVLAVAVAAPSAAQGPTQTTASPPAFHTGTAVVLLDVVIRDKKGRPVPDVKPDEVEVYEDGTRQKVESFRWVETEPLPVEGNAPPRVPDSARQINLVSLVFDQLGPDGRRLAAKAATSFLEKGLRPNTWVAVFQIDQRLALLQPFTNDAAKLRQAVASATTGTYKGVIDEQAAMEQAQKGLADSAVADVATSGRGAPASGAHFAALVQAQALVNMIRLSYSLQRQQQGTTSLYPLLALVRGHETLAGRKTLVYLSEGLQVP